MIFTERLYARNLKHSRYKFPFALCKCPRNVAKIDRPILIRLSVRQYKLQKALNFVILFIFHLFCKHRESQQQTTP